VNAVEILGTHLGEQTTKVALLDVVRKVAYVERAVGVVARGWGTSLCAASTGAAEAASATTTAEATTATTVAAASAATTVATAALAAAVAATLAATEALPRPARPAGWTRRERPNADATPLEQRTIQLLSSSLCVVCG
jgi:hypothetical protein